MFRSKYKANSRYVSIEARNDSLQFSSSFIARGAGASACQSCPSDPMIRSRYKANSRYVSSEAYPFALPCGERIEGKRIDASVVDIKTERIRCPAADIKKRTGDPSPLESSPEGKTDRCVLESDGRLLV